MEFSDNLPKVSVVVPVYNSEQYLASCLDSLLAQTCLDLEVVAVDDGSLDSSTAILSQYQKNHPDKLRVITQKNQGNYNARLRGIREANGEYIGFSDNDDLCPPKMFETMYDRAVKTNADIVVSPYVKVDEHTNTVLSTHMTTFGKEVLSMKSDPGFYPMLNTSLWNKLFKADLLKSNIQNYQQPPRVGEDVMVLAFILAKSDLIAFENTPFYQWRMHGDQYSKKGCFDDDFVKLAKMLLNYRLKLVEQGTDTSTLASYDMYCFVHLCVNALNELNLAGNTVSQQYKNYILQEFPKQFPLIIKNPYCSLRYNRKHQNRNLMPMFTYWLYRWRLLIPAFKLLNQLRNTSIVNLDWRK